MQAGRHFQFLSQEVPYQHQALRDFIPQAGEGGVVVDGAEDGGLFIQIAAGCGSESVGEVLGATFFRPPDHQFKDAAFFVQKVAENFPVNFPSCRLLE